MTATCDLLLPLCDLCGDTGERLDRGGERICCSCPPGAWLAHDLEALADGEWDGGDDAMADYAAARGE